MRDNPPRNKNTFVELSIFIALLIVLCWGTYDRNMIWKDDLSLWTDNVKKSPGDPRAHQYLGLAYHYAGDIDKAIKEYKKSLSLNPLQADVQNNIGVSYFYKGDVDAAITHFKHALSIEPANADAHYNLGIAYGEKGLYDLAYEEIAKGMRLR